MPFAAQKQHPNPVHGNPEAEDEDHPLPREWVSALVAAAGAKGVTLDWVNCGLCVDERGAAEAVEGVRRGTPGDFWKMAEESDNTLVIPTS